MMKELIFMLMETSLKGNGKMVKKMDMESFLVRMGGGYMVNGQIMNYNIFDHFQTLTFKYNQIIIIIVKYTL